VRSTLYALQRARCGSAMAGRNYSCQQMLYRRKGTVNARHHQYVLKNAYHHSSTRLVSSHPAQSARWACWQTQNGLNSFSVPRVMSNSGGTDSSLAVDYCFRRCSIRLSTRAPAVGAPQCIRSHSAFPRATANIGS